MEENKELSIKYEHIWYVWVIYSCISLILCVFTIVLSWSALVFVWVVVAELAVSFLVNYLNHTEQRLKAQAEEAKKAEKSKTDFLANMSHEIRTPMNAIVGMCELILRESDISRGVRENCYNIKSSGRSLLSIINDILDFSKIESGKMEMISDEFNIASTLNDVVNMAMARKGNKDIEIIVKVDPEIPRGIVGDELRIRQIVINILTNAIKFTREGSVTLNVTKTRQPYGINLNISVSDTGIGITEENLEKLFTSFQQVDTRKNRSVEGTGLGLAISKKLVTSMGGFINVSSKYGKGSKFKITIPMEVTDDRPFINVKDKENIHVISYLDFRSFGNEHTAKGYESVIESLKDRLDVDFRNFMDFQSFCSEMENYESGFTHCFIGKNEYLDNQDYFNELAEYMSVVLVQDRVNSIEPPNKIRCIYKPFYALSAAAILNNESIVDFEEATKFGTRFVAPNARILLVDDNEINREVAIGLMKPYQVKITAVSSGRAAIEAIKSKEYDLVFMDHMMPEMDGVEATQAIRRMDGAYFKKVPIIALTANAISGVRDMFIRSGFSDFLAKPIELNLLDKMLKNWLPDKLLQKPSETENISEGKIVKKRLLKNISIEKGLRYCGDLKRYTEILDMYFRSGEEKISELEMFFKEQNWNYYTIAIHALKSSSLNIGAENLSNFAKKLEIAGKAGDFGTIRNDHNRVMSLYKEVLEECETFLNDDFGHETVHETTEEEFISSFKLEIEGSMLEVYLEDLAAACEFYDCDEIQRLCSEAGMFSYLGRSLKPYFDNVRQKAEDFEYEAAADYVASIEEMAEEWRTK